MIRMTSGDSKARILGVGSPMMDLLARVPEGFLDAVPGAKGGMEWVKPEEMDALIARLPEPPREAPGGSAANTICALGRLGLPVALLGKMGRDKAGEAYKRAFQELGGSDACFKYTGERATGRCLSLITPDGERTMRTDLGAAMLIDVADVSPSDFQECRHVHIEGYGLYNPDFVTHVLKTATSCGCTVSLDLGSFEVVRSVHALLPGLLQDYVDIVFANEDEARAFCDEEDPERGLAALAACCDIAAVKLGAMGAWVQAGPLRERIMAVPVKKVVDTTGAGDCWAAGILFGHLCGLPLRESGRLASLIGAETVSCLGASPEEEGWRRIHDALKR